MSMTATEKILARHAGMEFVEPGELIEADVDLVLMNDITGPVAIKEFEKIGAKKVFDPKKIVFVNDHFAPNKDINSAEQCKITREFARKHGTLFYDAGVGIEHSLLPEEGLVHPGDLIIGADSHTCTYGAIGAFSTGVGSTDAAAAMISGKCWFKVPETMKFVYYGKRNRYVTGKDIILYAIGKIGVDGATYRAMEFTGEAIENLSLDEKFTICNMSVEAGAKSGIISNEREGVFSDIDAEYFDIIEFDASEIEPQVACPCKPSNTKSISEVQEEKIYIDQVVIGSCTNGRLKDLIQMYHVLDGRKVADGVRLIVIPATMKIYEQALNIGIIKAVIDAGGIVSPPTCGPCLGGYMGVLAEGEVCIATTNRNFVGRMGHPKSKVYLSSPYVAAASAVKGYICSPEVVLE